MIIQGNEIRMEGRKEESWRTRIHLFSASMSLALFFLWFQNLIYVCYMHTLLLSCSFHNKRDRLRFLEFTIISREPLQRGREQRAATCRAALSAPLPLFALPRTFVTYNIRRVVFNALHYTIYTYMLLYLLNLCVVLLCYMYASFSLNFCVRLL